MAVPAPAWDEPGPAHVPSPTGGTSLQIVTLWTRVRGEQQHCLNPKRQNTVRLLKWYRVWKEKGRVYEE
ncbi:c-x-c motif chemokine 14 [Limosa lapponica baueri]|uniref:C-x-c motif chemokine 14 n=1 Tax=Limosa lapponica baueri TaxID=1758121 RepID=A0A2I0T4D0_LIMLA|nr:c-x-c motif chemokine 14 [Limosa lapponica baueri]